MKVVLVESGQLDILQRQGIPCSVRDNNILAALRCVRQGVRETVEDALAELDHIVALAPSIGVKVGDDIFSKIGRKHECIWVSIANEQIVARSTCQRIAAVRPQGRTTRTRHDVAGIIELLSRERMRRVRHGR